MPTSSAVRARGSLLGKPKGPTFANMMPNFMRGSVALARKPSQTPRSAFCLRSSSRTAAGATSRGELAGARRERGATPAAWPVAITIGMTR